MSDFLSELLKGLGRGVQSGGNTMADVLREKSRRGYAEHQDLLNYERGQTARAADQEYEDSVRAKAAAQRLRERELDNTMHYADVEAEQRNADRNYNLNVTKFDRDYELDKLRTNKVLSERDWDTETLDALDTALKTGDRTRLDAIIEANVQRKKTTKPPPDYAKGVIAETLKRQTAQRGRYDAAAKTPLGMGKLIQNQGKSQDELISLLLGEPAVTRERVANEMEPQMLQYLPAWREAWPDHFDPNAGDSLRAVGRGETYESNSAPTTSGGFGPDGSFPTLQGYMDFLQMSGQSDPNAQL